MAVAGMFFSPPDVLLHLRCAMMFGDCLSVSNYMYDTSVQKSCGPHRNDATMWWIHNLQPRILRARQMCINLLTNACKFTISGGITMRISKHERLQSPYVDWNAQHLDKLTLGRGALLGGFTDPALAKTTSML